MIYKIYIRHTYMKNYFLHTILNYYIVFHQDFFIIYVLNTQVVIINKYELLIVIYKECIYI